LQREEGVLWDSERRLLRKRNIDLDPETERLLLDERLLAYVAFTRASQRLVVTRSLADENGRATHPSVFWNELRRLCPEAEVEHVARPSQGDAEGIGTPRQLVTGLMRWARLGGGKEGPWPALYQWLAKHQCCDDAIDIMRYRAWKALSYTNVARLLPETAGRLFTSPLQAGVAQIETFAACPFQHFLRYGLRLRESEEPDVTSLDLSRAYHQVLENLVSDVLKSRQDWCNLEPAATAELIRLYTAEIGRTLRGELMLSSARNRYLLERIERTLAQAIESQCEFSRRGKYRPAFAPLKFGEGETLPAHRIATPRGQEVQLRGKIDRVDLHEGQPAFTVADYKLFAGPLALDRVLHGLSLQLLVYLLVVQEGSEQLVGHQLTPAAAFFLQLLRSHQSVDHPGEAKAPDHPDFHLRHKPRGIMDAGAVRSFDAGTQNGYSPVAQFYVKTDGELGMRHASDVADESEFTALLLHVEKRIGELADGLISGDIRIEPYWIGRETPCPHCEFRSVCRFEPGIDKYHVLRTMKREDVLKMVTDGGDDAG
jgi:ATP-dependent helicase/nuclease subunit B